jgi:hypothetical protein
LAEIGCTLLSSRRGAISVASVDVLQKADQTVLARATAAELYTRALRWHDPTRFTQGFMVCGLIALVLALLSWVFLL